MRTVFVVYVTGMAVKSRRTLQDHRASYMLGSPYTTNAPSIAEVITWRTRPSWNIWPTVWQHDAESPSLAELLCSFRIWPRTVARRWVLRRCPRWSAVIACAVVPHIPGRYMKHTGHDSARNNCRKCVAQGGIAIVMATNQQALAPDKNNMKPWLLHSRRAETCNDEWQDHQDATMNYSIDIRALPLC